jgi:hypothetical protein
MPRPAGSGARRGERRNTPRASDDGDPRAAAITAAESEIDLPSRA